MLTGGKKILPERVTNYINKNKVPLPKNSEAFTCSNLVSAAYRKNGVDLGGKFTAPVDLTKSKKVTKLSNRFKKGFKEFGPANMFMEKLSL